MLLSFVIAALFSSVLAAVHHAEVIAVRLGEPFGTLILALAVTVIEVSLVVALMLSGGASEPPRFFRRAPGLSQAAMGS
jgi:Ca2+:H+ antiporter